MEVDITFRVRINVQTDDLDEAESLAKIEAQGMSNVLWADRNWNRFHYVSMSLAPEIDRQIKKLFDMYKPIK